MSCPHCGDHGSYARVDPLANCLRCSRCLGRIVANRDGTFPIPFTTRGMPLVDRLQVWWQSRAFRKRGKS